MNKQQINAAKKMHRVFLEWAEDEAVADVNMDWEPGLMHAVVLMQDGTEVREVYDFPGIPTQDDDVIPFMTFMYKLSKDSAQNQYPA